MSLKSATETIRGFDDKQQRAAGMCFLLLLCRAGDAVVLIDNVREFDEQTGDIGSLFWELIKRQDEKAGFDPNDAKLGVVP